MLFWIHRNFSGSFQSCAEKVTFFPLSSPLSKIGLRWLQAKPGVPDLPLTGDALQLGLGKQK